MCATWRAQHWHQCVVQHSSYTDETVTFVYRWVGQVWTGFMTGRQMGMETRPKALQDGRAVVSNE